MDEDGGRVADGPGIGELRRTGLAGYFVATAYNLVRMANLVACERARALQQT